MFALACHPSTPCAAVRSIDVALGRAGEGFRFYYFLVGAIDRLVIPPASSAPNRRDGLWRSTCFEALIKGDGPDYCEFNFAPSGDWASYCFDDYRAGMREAPTAVSIHCDRMDNLLSVEARFNADFGRSTRLSLSAVVEEAGGALSYWALAHPPGKPDFHHDACFAARLADIA